MKIKFDLGNGPQEVDRVGLGDMVAFERHFQLPATVMEPETERVLGPDGEPVQDTNDDGTLRTNKDGEPVWKLRILGEQKMEWIAYLVWRSARRQGLISKEAPFDEDFLDSIEDFGMEAEEGDGEGEASAAETTA